MARRERAVRGPDGRGTCPSPPLEEVVKDGQKAEEDPAPLDQVPAQEEGGKERQVQEGLLIEGQGLQNPPSLSLSPRRGDEEMGKLYPHRISLLQEPRGEKGQPSQGKLKV